MNKYLIAVLLFSCSWIQQALAQELPSIQLDRPDQTECPFITPTKYIQLESGFLIENIGKESKSLSTPTILWKYGLNQKFEFRLITELNSLIDGKSSTTGIAPITVGFKTSICQEKGIVPLTSFIGHITTAKIGTENFHTTYIAPSFRFVMQHTISDKVVVAYNLGAEWDGEKAAQTYIYTLTTGISWTEKFGSYFELFGFLPKGNEADHRFDCGITYLLNQDLILDLSGSISLSDFAERNYLALGISYRFKTTKK